jgi:RNA polymerase sigma-70 factor (ECF subfamily)
MDKGSEKPLSVLSTSSDVELLYAVKQGQVQALRFIYRRYVGLVYSLALRILRTPEEAEELTQEIFLRLWEANSYDPNRGSLGHFLVFLTRSRAIDRLRSQRSRQKALQAMQHVTPHRTVVNPLEQASLDERSHLIKAALANLSPAEREVLEVAYYEGLSQSETAKRLDIPLGTVKTRSRQALKKLRQTLHYEALTNDYDPL